MAHGRAMDLVVGISEQARESCVRSPLMHLRLKPGLKIGVSDEIA